MALIGYARVSTVGQSLENQIEQLKEYGCTKIFQEKQSGAKSDRQALHEALEYLREGDKLIVTKIDRLARSVKDLHNIASDLSEKGIGLVFLKEQIDFSTAAGKLMFTMLGAIGEFERDLINERTSEGRERAKKQGKHMGRPSQDKKKLQQALKLCSERETNGLSVNDIAKTTGVPRSTIYAELKKIKG
ncbi:recombinase family protein [Metabacillus fastidiosus]|uniref:Recombinase family protein n=1 Tax=Metabacillus fastidiosus TaxID=1458 RepID=A0ABU6P2Z7_9BACI|nr:recombinase family protein [Metabacillus fastidiosus]